MIPIPIIWTEYTATVNGRVLKLVPCENCDTEYVYAMERESTWTATCPYSVLGEDERGRLDSSAEESVQQYLDNDFDAVPCPACGHYQKFMFPKLMQAGCLGTAASAVVLVAGGLALIGVVLQAVECLNRPSESAMWRLAGGVAAAAVVGGVGAGVWAVRRAAVRNFDPNTQKDLPARIALARSRAYPRAEFEAGGRAAPDRGDA